MSTNIIAKTFRDKKFLKQATSIAIPVALQLVLSTVTNMIDTMMIGKLGTATISAVGLSNKFFFVFALLVFGVHSGTGLLMAQYFGNNDHFHIRKTVGLGLIINLTVAFLFLAAAFFIPEKILGIFTNSVESTAIGIVYLSTVCFCYPLFGCTSLLNSFLRSTRQVRVPVISAIVSIIVNITLNYGLIFGHFGLPAMGVKGAAIATVIARLAELLILVYFSFFRSTLLKGKISDFFGWSSAFLSSFATHSLPVILNEMIWGLGQTMYFVAYGHIDDNAVAAVTITNTVTDILMTTGNGLASAAAVLLGNELGAGKLEKADDYSKKLLVLGAVTGSVMGTLLLLLRGPILSIYDVSPEVSGSASVCMAIFACLMPVIFPNLLTIVGILRAGGDSKVCFIIDTFFVWFWAIPAAFIGVMIFHLPVTVIYFLVTMEEFIKTVFVRLRYKKKAWLNNLAKEV